SGRTPICSVIALTIEVQALSLHAALPISAVPGLYCWRAEYSGDGAYLPASHTDNSAECFFLVQLTPTVTTQSSWGSAPPTGTLEHDTAHVSTPGPTPTRTPTSSRSDPGLA